MIQAGGITYRVERCKAHCYALVRVLDDVEVGTFRTYPSLRIHPTQIDMKEFRDVVRAALRSARTSSVMRVAPVCTPDQGEASTARSPSTMPPRTTALA